MTHTGSDVLEQETSRVTPSFAQATGKLRQTFSSMTAETAPMQRIMRDKIFLHNHWNVEKPDPLERGHWLSFHHYTAFGKGLLPSGLNNDRYKRLISEKFLCDLAYDLGLPHACCTFQRLSKNNLGYPALVSLVPFRNAASLDQLTQNTNNRALQALLKDHPPLIDAFLALSLFDLWCSNYDRFAGNLVSDAIAANPDCKPNDEGIIWGTPPTCLVGIDLEKNMLFSHFDFEIGSLNQHSLFRKYATPEHSDIIRTTVMAIEKFPAERIAATAKRLECLAPKLWKSHNIIRTMKERQYKMRPMLDDGLGSKRRFELGL